MELNEQLRADQALIEDALTQYAEQWPSYGVLKDAMSYSLLSGGKRIRPVLTLAVCRLFGGQSVDALPFACGLEMLHTYSLIHDDLPCMDDDDVRRGKPTNHKVFGEANAVLAGDGLLTAAFATVASSSLPSERVQRAVLILAQAAGPAGMVGGQVLDLEGEGKALGVEEITTIELLKTGCMIEAAARLGAVAAGSSQTEEDAAASYARKLGLAFQIRDDLLDVLGTEAEFGKPIGLDLANQKSTFVACKGLDGCQKWIEELTTEAISSLDSYSDKEFLCGLARLLAGRNK